jgi:hypothetical protein
MTNGRSQSVAILFSEHEEPEQYVVSRLARYWREDGIEVFYLRGTRSFVPADVLFLHVDLSVLPAGVSQFAQRYPVVINQHVRDIRKRTYSTLMVSREDRYDGPVIVKSNFNFGGSPESGKHPSRAHRFYHRARRVYFRLLTGSWGYHIYPSVTHVPVPIWCDPNLLVERFVPERVGRQYAVRTYHYFGERESFFLLTSPEPIVKSGPETRMHPIEPDPRLRAFRRRLKLDYGKIDYVLADGEPVVLDLNKTIGLTERFADDPEVERARRERASAIHDFLR